MSLIHKEPYITPEMISVCKVGIDPVSTYKYTDATRDGKVYFQRYGKVVFVILPVMKGLNTIDIYEVATIPNGYRPKMNTKYRYSTGIATGISGSETDEESYTIHFMTDGRLTIYPRQAMSKTTYNTDSTFSYICE